GLSFCRLTSDRHRGLARAPWQRKRTPLCRPADGRTFAPTACPLQAPPPRGSRDRVGCEGAWRDGGGGAGAAAEPRPAGRPGPDAGATARPTGRADADGVARVAGAVAAGGGGGGAGGRRRRLGGTVAGTTA